MPYGDQRHSVRMPLPDMIVRGRSHVIEAPVYLNGALQTPSSWSVTVYNASNESVETGSGSASLAQHTIGAGDLSAQALGEGWRVEWVLTLATTTLYPRNDAYLVRNGLWPVITDQDISRRLPSLSPGGPHPLTPDVTWQDPIDEAWTEIQLRLLRLGQRPYLVMEPSALRTPHLYLALALIFENERSRLNAAWESTAMGYRQEYERAWSELNPKYDSSDSGQADSRRRAVQPTVWLNGGRDSWRGR